MEEKLRKLLALAEHPGTGAAEAAAAANMAAELAMKYSIDLDSVRGGKQDRANYLMGPIAGQCLPGDRQALSLLASGVGALYGTQITLLSSHNRSDFRFVGQEHTTALSTKWLEYLWEACQKSNKQWTAKQPPQDNGQKYKADRSFRLMFAASVYKRLLDKRDSMKNQGVDSTGTALMVVNWYEQERQAVVLWMEQQGGLDTNKKVRSNKKDIDPAAGSAGLVAGKSIGLDEQISGPAARRGLSEQRRLGCD